MNKDDDLGEVWSTSSASSKCGEGSQRVSESSDQLSVSTKEALTWRERWRAFPKQVFFIFGNEFCERYSYYGISVSSMLYSLNIMGISKRGSVSLRQGMTAVLFITAIIGSFIADGWIGRYKTIVLMTLVHLLGSALMSISALYAAGANVHPILDYFGFIILAFGSGGIKTSVSPFGGDQFVKGQKKDLDLFLSIFYMSINVAAVVALVSTPFIRRMSCFGEKDCYSVAYLVPGILMIVACVLFMIGTPWYRRFPPKSNVVTEVFKIIFLAIKNRWKFSGLSRFHWLDHALDSHSCRFKSRCTRKTCYRKQIVQDFKSMLRIFIIFFPMPFISALFTQAGALWTLQALDMNGRLENGDIFLIEFMGLVDPLLVIILIPFTESLVYPFLNRFVNVTALRRMVCGTLLLGFSFVCSAIVQIQLDKSLLPKPAPGTVNLALINLSPCNVSFVNYTDIDGIDQPVALPFTTTDYFNLPAGKNDLTINDDAVCSELARSPELSLSPYPQNYGILTEDGSFVQFPKSTQKSTLNDGSFTININNFISDFENCHFALCAASPEHRCSPFPKDTVTFATFSAEFRTASSYKDVRMGKWDLHIWSNQTNGTDQWVFTGRSFSKEEMDGIYTLTAFGNTSVIEILVSEEVAANSVPIFWQIPQRSIIAISEILIFVTGMQFSYSQAPLSMKSIVMAMMFFTMSIGNFALSIATSFKSSLVSHPVMEHFVYAGIMFAVGIVFAILSKFYKPMDHLRDEAEEIPMAEAND